MNIKLNIESIRITIVVLILFFASCGSKPHAEVTSAEANNLLSTDTVDVISTTTVDSIIDEPLDEFVEVYDAEDIYSQPNIANTIGVVSFEGGKERSVPIELLNADGSTWFSFELSSVANGEENNKLVGEKLGNGLHPRLIEYYFDVFVFDCVSVSVDYYTVIVNYRTRETKRLKRTKGLVFETWEQHVTSGTMLLPSPMEGNPLLNKPNGEPIEEIVGEAYRGMAVDGDWLKVYDMFDDEKEKTGWIRWRNGNKLLIQLYYMY